MGLSRQIFVVKYLFNEAGDNWHQWLGYTAAVWFLVRFFWEFQTVDRKIIQKIL
jgi:cytochrome b